MTLKKWAMLILAIILGTVIYLIIQYRTPLYRGPISDHFDGLRFSNADGVYAPRGLKNFIKWRFQDKATAWPEHRNNLFIPVVKPRIMGDNLQVTFVGHATVLLQTEGLNILTDPIWSERASPVQFSGPKRVHAPGIDFSALPPIDIVLISHNHYDQMDIPTLQRLEQRFHPVFITGLGNDTLLKKRLGDNARIVTLDWWQSHNINKEMNVLFVPANHWSKRSLFDTNKTLWGGFVIQSKDGNIYFAGDTGFSKGSIFSKIANYGPFRLALLPIGAYEPRWFMHYSHVNPEESVEIFKILNPRYAMAIHFGTFHLTNEGIDEPVMALDQALSKAHVTPQQFRVLQVGQDWQVPFLEKKND